MICFSTFLSGAEEGRTETLPRDSPSYAELSGSAAQEALTAWTQLRWDSFSLSCFTPRRVWDGIRSCILQHRARQLFPKPDSFSKPANERRNQNSGTWACPVSSSARCFCFRMGAAKNGGWVTFSPTPKWLFSNLWASSLCQMLWWCLLLISRISKWVQNTLSVGKESTDQ